MMMDQGYQDQMMDSGTFQPPGPSKRIDPPSTRSGHQSSFPDPPSTRTGPPLVLRCKVALMGDAKVGKTALASVLCAGSQTYPKSYNMSMGVESFVTTVDIPHDDHVKVEVHLLDCSGAEGGKTLVTPHLASLNAGIFVYDVGNQDSLNNVTDWMSLLPADLPKYLVANKADAHDHLSEEQIAARAADVMQSLAQHFHENNIGGGEFQGIQSFVNGRPFVTSAQKGDVGAPFEHIAFGMYETYQERIQELRDVGCML